MASSSSFTVHRPVVRSFSKAYEAEAAAWVRAGGHAVVWDTRVRPNGRTVKHATLVVGPIPRETATSSRSDLPLATQLALFSLLDLGKKRWTTPVRGVFAGLTTATVPPGDHWIVRRRIERDGTFPAATQALLLDCLACGACCKANEVFLHEADLERFREGGRPELAKPPFTRRKDGKTLMTLLPDEEQRCRHLAESSQCDIYELRPEPCRDFPAGSECCLYTREEELGLNIAYQEHSYD